MTVLPFEPTGVVFNFSADFSPLDAFERTAAFREAGSDFFEIVREELDEILAILLAMLFEAKTGPPFLRITRVVRTLWSLSDVTEYPGIHKPGTAKSPKP